MATEVLRLHFGFFIRREVLRVWTRPMDTSNTSTAASSSTYSPQTSSPSTAPTSSSYSGRAQLLEAVVRLQLLSLGLLSGNVRGHGVIIRYRITSSSSPSLLLLLLMLMQHIIPVHLLLQEALQDGVSSPS